jgi:hypothetical protein
MRNAIIVAALAAFIGLSATALAQNQQPAAGGADPAAQPAGQPGQAVQPAGQPGQAVQSGVAAGAVAQPAAATPSGVALRPMCEKALREDAEWRSELKAQLVSSLLQDAPDPKDAAWRAQFKQRLAGEVHTEDARLMLNNKKHVVMAYAVLWILVMAFMAFMWMRQQGLKAEIARLQSEIRDAAKEGGES